MTAQRILAVMAVIFLLMAGLRAWRDGRLGPAARTWLLVGLIFAAVSLWLWRRT
jgi:hypothetical protein